jgi:hypothetical protein
MRYPVSIGEIMYMDMRLPMAWVLLRRPVLMTCLKEL